MRLEKVLAGVGVTSLRGDKSLEISELTRDSRAASPGCLFIALPGAHTDGNRHIKEAIEKGAAAVLSELTPPPAPISLTRRGAPHKPVAWAHVVDVFEAMGKAASNFYGDPSSAMTVVGVTGTNGKTTTAYFLESIVSQAGGVPGVVGTVSHRLRHRLLEKAANTTPFSLDLTRLLARMRDGGATCAAMEVSSHALATKRVEEIHFDAAIMTNLHRDHLDFHKTREEYFAAKARLFELLEKAYSPKKRRVAVLNRDDETFERLKRRITQARVVGYGINEEADYRAESVSPSVRGSTFRIHERGRQWTAHIRLLGEHNVYNALAAAAAAWELGMDGRAVLSGLSALAKVPGRLEPVQCGQDFSVLVDYAHTDSALETVLGYLRRLEHRKLITVFGCGGDRDKTKRAPMGKAACAGSDLAIATSDNPRGEEPERILNEVEAGMREAGRENYRIIPDRKEAIYEAVRAAHKGDILLIAGKGHEDYQILRDRTVHFDDREVAARALKDCGKA